MIHELKIMPCYFKQVINGVKNFEVRNKMDRIYTLYDELLLKEWDNDNFTGNSVLVDVLYILDDEKYCAKDMVIMAIKIIKINI